MDKIEPILYSVVRKDLERQGMRWVVHVGDKTVDYNESFRMFLVTRNPYPAIPPSAASVVAEVNFTVTRSGLEGQLLGLVIQHEQPALEKQKSHLLRVEEDLKVQLAGLEKTLLETLATSTGNILENEALIQSLDETKAKGTTVKESLEESTTLQKSLDEQREAYRPIAAQGSKMFFLTRDLRALNHMYQFSLNSFIALFKSALAESAPSPDLDRRIDMLSHALLRLVFAHVSRSIFNADRLTFGMHFARHLAKERADADSWNFYFGLDAGDAAARGGAVPRWVPQEVSGRYANLVGAFPAIASAYDLEDGGKWSDWMRSPNAEACVPSGAARRERFRGAPLGAGDAAGPPRLGDVRFRVRRTWRRVHRARAFVHAPRVRGGERLVARALHRHARVGPEPGARGARGVARRGSIPPARHGPGPGGRGVAPAA